MVTAMLIRFGIPVTGILLLGGCFRGEYLPTWAISDSIRITEEAESNPDDADDTATQYQWAPLVFGHVINPRNGRPVDEIRLYVKADWSADSGEITGADVLVHVGSTNVERTTVGRTMLRLSAQDRFLKATSNGQELWDGGFTLRSYSGQIVREDAVVFSVLITADGRGTLELPAQTLSELIEWHDVVDWGGRRGEETIERSRSHVTIEGTAVPR